MKVLLDKIENKELILKEKGKCADTIRLEVELRGIFEELD